MLADERHRGLSSASQKVPKSSNRNGSRALRGITTGARLLIMLDKKGPQSVTKSLAGHKIGFARRKRRGNLGTLQGTLR
jgi:hypothetical protein